LLAAVSGGKLFQHVDNHVSYQHPLISKEHVLKTNSCHHQMVIPNDDMDVLAYTPCLSRIKVTTKQVVDEGDEAEIIHFPKIKALGVQGHPEWLPHEHDLNKLVLQLLNEKLGVKL
jgi:gamma-glutamyl-gamma-aminobutyrate hydrolase PuuD